MRIVFMGTPDFALPCLHALIDDGQEVVGVFTQPDKPVGRHAVLTPPPVKELAQSRGIQVFQPAKMRDGSALELLRSLKPDLAVVVAYGRILPRELLDTPRLGCLNVHASLLPKYRGSAPIQWCVVNGEKTTGVTTMYMDEGMDTGDIIEQTDTAIGENETAGELSARLSELGAGLMLSTLRLIESGSVPRRAQNHAEATTISMIEKSMARIDLTRGAHQVHDLVRGMNPWPVAYIGEGGGMLKVCRTAVAEGKGEPGELLDDRRLIIACGGGAVELLEVIPAGKKPMSGADYMRGARLSKGAKLIV